MKRKGEKPRNFLRRRPQKGSIMVLTALVITGMIGIMALSIDLDFLFNSRNQFQNGIDAAALAGATGFRVSIEADAGMPQQTTVVKDLAVQYAGFNTVRRHTDPDPESDQPNRNKIEVDRGSVTIDLGSDLPKVRVNTNLDVPLLFAGLFGFEQMNINAGSQASIFPVDGGTGTTGACWRPIFLPDTFYDIDNIVHYLGDPRRPMNPLPNLPGDFYRSRFAVGARNIPPFFQGPVDSPVTGLRDTESLTEVSQQTLMGMQPIIFGRYTDGLPYYFIADFTGLPRATISALSTGDLANFGYCGQIRVGDVIPVYLRSNAAIYDQVRTGLESLLARNPDNIDVSLKAQYSYIKSDIYPDPNSHALILPVLLFNPFEFLNNPRELKVTNFGLFFLETVQPDGTLSGFFVREIITGGTPIQATNISGDTLLFQRRWLPMSTQLLR
ncbi:MAG: pilus assembly protein [Acidobacteria bacterium]|nr:pilus assembly protein [Acidobacteriota bacterium]